MDLNFGTNFANPKRCVKEFFLEIGHNIKEMILTKFHAREERNYWIIDIGLSNNMIGDKSRLIKLMNFGDDTSSKIYGKVSISFDGKHKIDTFFISRVSNIIFLA